MNENKGSYNNKINDKQMIKEGIRKEKNCDTGRLEKSVFSLKIFTILWPLPGLQMVVQKMTTSQ